jgi:hypothetical protein
MTEPAAPGADRTCPWCSEPAQLADTTCSACGAALAQREDLGGIVIPGVTGVDPALAAFDAQPTHLRGPSATQGLATGIIPAAAMGGPAGLAIIGGIAAVAAVEYMSGKGPGGGRTDPESVGTLGGVAQLALEKFAREGEATPGYTVELDSDGNVEPKPAVDSPPEG